MANYSTEDYITTLGSELVAIDGMYTQDPETGNNLTDAGKSFNSILGNYSNRLFGAPFQLLDSVDKRFNNLNPNVGSEYLRNFLLHSPILHVKPGMPKYTGGNNPTSILRAAQDIYSDSNNSGGVGFGGSLGLSLAKGTLFAGGKTLQQRMFGFRPTYNNYMLYVNYMCRTAAILMGLSGEDESLPDGTFIGGSSQFQPFTELRWENYRMTDSTVRNNLEHAEALLNATGFGAFGSTVSRIASHAVDVINPWGDGTKMGDVFEDIYSAWQDATNDSIYSVMANKIESFMMLVEPVAFTENLANETATSMIESAIDGISDSVGAEIGFMTNSAVDGGLVDDMMSFLGNTTADAAKSVAGLVQPVTGGFLNNLFSGAIDALKGQKMIYPEIYKSSKSTMDYEFSVTLTSPYGDRYNYFMNIIVPLMHLMAIASPRMVTSNTVSSPFLVQAYIPGMCTCQLGIVQSMTIIKNPKEKHVSVNGFPLTVKVQFTIKELYNAMSISPASDPASYLFNETLNDYLANLAGLVPSMDTYSRLRDAAFSNVGDYFTGGKWVDDITGPWIEGVEDLFGEYR